MLARMKAGIEATAPMPLVDVDRNAGPLADGADMDVVKIDVPGYAVRIVGAAAGEGGHREVALICHPEGARSPLW